MSGGGERRGERQCAARALAASGCGAVVAASRGGRAGYGGGMVDGEPLPLRVRSMLELFAQQTRLLEQALESEHRRQRVVLERMLAAQDGD